MTLVRDLENAVLPALTPQEIRRYSRHLIMPEVGTAGQQALKAAKVLMVGTGGLGSPLGMYLAAAGVGTLGLVEFDTVDESSRVSCPTSSTWGLTSRRRSTAASIFGRPTSESPNRTCRWRFDTSTRSKSTRPSVPTPAAAR